MRKLKELWGRRGDRSTRSHAGSTASSANSSRGDVRQEGHPGHSSIAPVTGSHPQTKDEALAKSPTNQSLWDRAYDALKEDKAQLVAEYEKLLLKEAQMTSSASNSGGNDSQSRQAQLETVIAQGLRRMDEKKVRYTIAGHEFDLTDQIAEAAELVLWAKDWIGEAVKASPEASVAWAGVCIVLPLLTNPKTAGEANRDGFAYVTTRMRYYAALEPLLCRLGENIGATDALLAEAHGHLVDLYQHILAFQIQSVLRFYQSRLKGYVIDVFLRKDWKQMRLDIETREATVNGDLRQINTFVARQELESLNKTSIDSFGTMQDLLSVSKQQLQVLEVQRIIAQQQLAIQQDAVRQKLSDEQKTCLQLFRLTNSDRDVTYEWYKNRVEDRVPDTCLWFLRHDHFQRWLAQESGPLLVSADPGCGKSVLAKYLIDHELPQQSATICYYFFKDQDQNTARQALCALIHQLFSQKPALVQHAMESFAKEGPGLIHSTESLWAIFRSAVRDPQAGPVTIVLDALDECAETEFEGLMRNVENQCSSNTPSKLKFLMTSRPYKQIVSKFQRLLERFPHIHIPGEEQSEDIGQEINRVIGYRVEQLARDERLSDKVKGRLKEKLLSIPHRTYLWVYLVFDYLKTDGVKNTEKGVDAAFTKLPQTVNDAYEHILSKSKKDPTVRKILSVVLAASRPLTLREMNVAVNVNDTVDETTKSSSIADLDLEDEEHFKSSLRSLCGLFVSIHHGNIYFLHQTAREFLLRTDLAPSSAAVSPELCWHHSISIRDAHTVLAKLCVLYLNFFNSGTSLPDGNGRLALLDYSARYWGTHFREADIADDAAIVPFALSISCSGLSYSTWIRIYWSAVHSGTFPVNFEGLPVASYFGHDSVVKLLLNRGAAVETKDNSGRTPLSWAAERGHAAIVKQLLDRDADVKSKDRFRRRPLLYAFQGGHEAVVTQLLDHVADIEAKVGSSRTPLLWAAEDGHEAVVRQLLDRGANVETKDDSGRTPLLWATKSGHVVVVNQLLEHDADIEVKSTRDFTPLLFAVTNKYEAVVKKLLDYNADVEAKTIYGQTPLSLAAETGQEIIVKQLLDHNADVETMASYGRTPLSFAAEMGHVVVVKQLLDHGADIETKTSHRRRPLWLATKNGNEIIVKQLLDHEANVETKAGYGRTPLSFAAEKGHEAVVKQLLDRDANVEAKSHSGQTPLWLAAENGHEAVVKLLLDHGANVKAKDDTGWTPLSRANYKHTGVIALLKQSIALK